MRNIIYIFTRLFFFIALPFMVKAQQLPVTLTTALQPPYSLYLEDYFAPASNKLSANILFNDFNEPSWDVRLKITIESDRIRLQTRPDFIPSKPITLVPGVMSSVSGMELDSYLDLDNMLVTGARDQLRQNGRLPDGMYKFCIEVVDYQSSKPLSHASCATAWLSLNDPPRIIFPACGQFIRPMNPANIVFQWQLTGPSPNFAMGVEYQLVMHELLDISADPRSAINNAKTLPVYESDWVTNLQLVYDMAAPILDVGKVYVYYVQVKDIGGRDLFKNNGASEICWFYYGYPENARIELVSPKNRHKFAKFEMPDFTWTAPNAKITGQPFLYHVKLVEILPGQDSTQAMENNPTWYEYDAPITMSAYGMAKQLDKPLAPSQKYAWQVIAHSGEQLVAKSDIFIVEGPPVIDYLQAGDYVVKITSTKSGDMNDLSGTGKLKIGGEDSVEVYFDHIKVEDRKNYFVLTSGELIHKFKSLKEVVLTPAISENKEASLFAEKLKLTTEGLQLYGEIKWPLPHPVQTPEKAYVIAKPTWYRYDKYKIDGQGYLNDKNTFDLLEPLGFQLNLKQESYFLIDDNNYRIYTYGEVLLPEKVKGSKEERISLPFNYKEQLFYIEENISEEKLFCLAKNTEMYMTPVNYFIDFSETESPGKKSEIKEWKGIYFHKYKVKYQKNMDQYKQLQLSQDIYESFELTSSNSYINWVDYEGLDFSMKKSLSFTATTFNTFPAIQKQIQLQIENSGVTDSWLKGSIKIPVISESEEFSYTVPINERGFATGFLDESLDGRKFDFNKDGGEQKMQISILRAVFANQEKLVMMLDLTWPHINSTFKNVKGFSIWGNYNIGFNQPNGSIALDNQVKSEVNGYPITLDILGCGRQSNLYSFGASGKIVLGDDIAGPAGPTEVNFYSIANNSLLDPNVSVGKGSVASGNGVNGNQLPPKEALKRTAEQKLNAVFVKTSEAIEQTGSTLKASIKFTEVSSNTDVEEHFKFNFDNDKVTRFDVPKVYNLAALQGLMKELLEYLPEEKRGDGMKVIELISDLPPEVQQKTFEELTDLKKMAIDIMARKLEESIENLMKPITVQVEKVQKVLNDRIYGSLNSINAQVDSKVRTLVEGVSGTMSEQAKGEKFNAEQGLNIVREAVIVSLSGEIKDALSQSVQKNIISRFQVILGNKITKGVRSHIAKKLAETGYGMLEEKQSKSKLDNIIKGIDVVFVELGKDILDDFDFKGVEGSIQQSANDLISGISIDGLTDRLADELVEKFGEVIVEKFVEAYGEELAKGYSGAAMGVLADNVSLDFTNIKDKIVEGRIHDIIKFDPTNIKVETSVATIQGTIHFKDDDPKWGDAWGGELGAKVKIQPEFGAKARFMTGKKEKISFWFFDVKVSNLNIPMTPTPFTFDGADGRVYKHMIVNNTGNYMITKDVDYGANLQLNFFDTPSKGKIIKFDVGAKVEIIPGGFKIAMLGNSLIGNAKGFSFATGKGELSYNSAEKHFIGAFGVNTNTKPLLCAGGTMGVDVKPNAWVIAIGTRQSPITVNPFCGGAFKTDGWLMINKEKVDLGLHIRQSLKIESPVWIGIPLCCSIKPYANAGFDFEASGIVQFDPIGVQEAQVSIDMWAGVGCYWETFWDSGKWDLASVALGGKLGFQTIEKTRMWGKMYGEVTVAGIDVDFSLKADHTF